MFTIQNQNRVAAYDADNDLTATYKELILISKKKIFSKKKALFLVLCENSMGCLATYFSIVQKKNIAMLASSKITNDDLSTLIKKFKPNYLALPQSYCYKGNKLKKVEIVYNYKIIKIFLNKKFQINNQIKLLLSTSGTTTEKKWAKISQKNIQSNLVGIIKSLKIKADDIAITTLPFEYSYGLSIINTHLFMNAKIILTKKSVIENDFWNILKKYKVTNFGGVEFTYEILEKIRFGKFLNGSHLKYLSQAGSALNPELHKKIYRILNKNKIKLYIMYGMTEAGPRISIMRDDGNIKKRNYLSVGKEIDGVKVFVKNNKSKTNKVGQLYLSSKSIFGGYAKKIVHLKIFKNQKILKLGDLGYFDQKKFLFITGRSNRICKIKGIRINLAVVEKHIKQKLRCNTHLVSDDRKIYIFSNENKIKKINKSDLKKILNININDISIKFIREIPKSENRKTSYSGLMKLINNEKIL